MNIELGPAMGIVGIIFGIYMGYLNFKKVETKDAKIDAAGDAELKTDIKYIARGVEDIRVDMKVQEKRHSDLSERVVRVEESSKSAHLRLDTLNK
ncbi:MAG TPA: hypothetical protein VMV86_00870 [Methanosarcinales archaeon]|nr:hypothetical protein [Methanosarcinales archaeon]